MVWSGRPYTHSLRAELPHTVHVLWCSNQATARCGYSVLMHHSHAATPPRGNMHFTQHPIVNPTQSRNPPMVWHSGQAGGKPAIVAGISAAATLRFQLTPTAG